MATDERSVPSADAPEAAAPEDAAPGNAEPNDTAPAEDAGPEGEGFESEQRSIAALALGAGLTGPEYVAMRGLGRPWFRTALRNAFLVCLVSMAANVASGLFNGSLAAIGLALAAVVVAAGALVASLSLRRRLRRMRPESVRANGKPWAGSRRWREFVGAMTAALADAHRIAVAAGRGERPIGSLRRFVALLRDWADQIETGLADMLAPKGAAGREGRTAAALAARLRELADLALDPDLTRVAALDEQFAALLPYLRTPVAWLDFPNDGSLVPSRTRSVLVAVRRAAGVVLLAGATVAPFLHFAGALAVSAVLAVAAAAVLGGPDALRVAAQSRAGAGG